MGTREAWYEFSEGLELPGGTNLVAALRSAGGIELHPRDQDSTGPGIVFFDRITAALKDFLREASRAGAARVLAVASRGGTLRDASGWELLDAGASDVIAWDHSADVAAEIVATLDRWRAVDDLLDSSLVRGNLIGRVRPGAPCCARSSRWRTSRMRRCSSSARVARARS